VRFDPQRSAITPRELGLNDPFEANAPLSLNEVVRTPA